MREIHPTPTSATCGAQGADLVAARNEFESFQVEVRAPAGGALTGVAVVLTECFEWCRGNPTAAADAVTIYREGYVGVHRRSDIESSPDPLSSATNTTAGSTPWADPLIPERDYFYGEDRSAFPTDVPAGANRVAWVDVLVPQGQAAGTYSASLKVTAAGGLSQVVPISLTVLGVSLPSTPSLETAVDLSNAQVCAAFGCAGNSVAGWEMNSLLARAGRENRFGFFNTQNGDPAAGSQLTSFRTYQLPDLTGTAPSRLPGARTPNVLLHEWCVDDEGSDACIRAWANVARNENFQDQPVGFYLYCEELFNDVSRWNGCRQHWLDARARWNDADGQAPWIDSGVPPPVGPLRVAAVATVDALAWAASAGHTTWTTATQDVDLLMPNVIWLQAGDHQDSPAGPFPGHRADYDQWLAASPTHRLWWYTACGQFGCEPDDVPDSNNDGGYESDSQLYVGWPGEGIDQPSAEARAMGTLSYTYGVAGEQYYEAVKRLTVAWNDCSGFFDTHTCVFSEGGNGDGTLFYPGTVARIGGTHPIPVESIRIKRLRDGREDYEWLRWLGEHGRASFARAEGLKLVPTAGCADSPNGVECRAPGVQGTATFAQVRSELAAEIQSLTGGGASADLSLTVVPDSTDATVGDESRYVVTAANAGPDPAASVSFTVPMYRGEYALSARTDRGSCTVAPNRLSVACAASSLDAGAALTATVEVVSVLPGDKGMSFRVDAATPDPDPSDNSFVTIDPVTVRGTACTVFGTVGDDAALVGTGGGDVVCGFTGDDTISAGAGSDIIYAGGGVDIVAAQDGNDTIVGGAGDDTIDGGPGSDWVELSDARAAVGVNLSSGESFCEAAGPCGVGRDSIAIGTVENVRASAFTDGVIGDDRSNVLVAVGVDPLNDGNDDLLGKGGDDVLIGGPGNDEMDGAAGSDTAYYGNSLGAVTVDLGIVGGAQQTGGAGSDSLAGIENLTGSNLADTLLGDAGPNTIDAGAGNDIVNGRLGDDRLIGGDGAGDTVTYQGVAAPVTASLATAAAQPTGGAGSDRITGTENLTGTAGADHLVGNSAANTLRGGDGDDVLTDASGGNDTLLGESGNDTLTGGAGDDVLTGGPGTDTVTYAGTSAGVTASLNTVQPQSTGSAGKDTITEVEKLTGTSFKDTLLGNSGPNTLIGGDGDDNLSAGASADVLSGGNGTDTCNGGTETDTSSGCETKLNIP